MVGAAWSTTIRIVFAVLLLVSLAINVASFTVNTVSMAIGTVIEAVTGVETLVSRYRRQNAQLASQIISLKSVKAEKAVLQTELVAVNKTADWWKGRAVTNALSLEEKAGALKLARVENAAVQSELVEVNKMVDWWKRQAVTNAQVLEDKADELVRLRATQKVVYEGLEMPVQEAVTRASRKIKTRTVKLATADLSATAAQSLPWIGAAAVIAATGYDLKMSCDTMKDMREIELAVNPQAEDDPDVEWVCGMRVPTEAEVWETIKAGPNAVWQAWKSWE